MIEGHEQGPNCPCSKTLLADEHPHKCPCGGYYHLVSEHGRADIICDVCGKDRDAYTPKELRI